MGRFWGLRAPGSQAMPWHATILLRPHQHEVWDALAWLGEMILTAGMAAGPQKIGSQESQDGVTDCRAYAVKPWKVSRQGSEWIRQADRRLVIDSIRV